MSTTPAANAELIKTWKAERKTIRERMARARANGQRPALVDRMRDKSLTALIKAAK